MEYSELIPKTKSDYERVALLKEAEKEKILPILPQLLEWLQDMNWPIAQDIEDIILKYEEHLITHIRVVMKSNDGGWKYFLLHGLITRLSNEILLELKPDLVRMKLCPTKDEIVAEIAEKIEDLLVRIDSANGKRS
ncbi:DUF5071 domain-containing protein [Paenibacillus sp. PL91]|uniref:DUF5071 domain-containing protein n=1 Tax=Paenibacillus sp. PL91 TaxID=2729538 RepID=UPI00145C4A71|nr:DUF5071 domain-containing protein [Paenibacillus sp. PL91]MBC9200033.1 DUF5071 domain-containing protein [Paenibacillus sp. PL91]